jgi:hypothetical protein
MLRVSMNVAGFDEGIIDLVTVTVFTVVSHTEGGTKTEGVRE